jgi:hypothetical protein
MVLWVPLLLSQIIFGFEISSLCLSSSLSTLPLAAAAIPTGITTSTIIYRWCSAVIGHNIFHLILHIVGLIIIITQLYPLTPKPTRPDLPNSIVMAIFAVICTIFVYSVYLPEGYTQLTTTLPQLQPEIALISSFTHGCNSGLIPLFSLHHPNQIRERIKSNWVTALHPSMLRAGFASLRTSLCITSICFLFSYAILMYFICREFKLPVHVAFFVPFLTPLLASYSAFDLRSAGANKEDLDFVSVTKTTETNFFHPLLHFLIGLRPTALALSVSSVVLLVFTKALRSKDALTILALQFMAFLVGYAALVQSESSSGICIFTTVALICYRSIGLLKIGNFFAAFAVALALFPNPPILWIWEISTPNFWQPYRAVGRIFPYPNFWFDRFGFFVFLALLLPWFVLSWREWKLFIPVVATFLISGSLQLHDKQGYAFATFYTGFLPMATVLYVVTLFRIARKMKFDEEWRGFLDAFLLALTLANCASGVVGFAAQFRSRTILFDEDDEQLIEWVLKNTAKRSVFLTPLEKFSAFPSLTGRIAFTSLPELTEAFGIDYLARKKERDGFCLFPEDIHIFKDVEYFVKTAPQSGKDECKVVNLPEADWVVAFHNTKYTVYQQRKRR